MTHSSAHSSAQPPAGRRSGPARAIGLVAIIIGALMVVGGAATWVVVTDQLTDEKIVIPDDARAFGGKTVNGPIDAYFMADIINKHALDASGGKTYAELDREDPVRDTMMNASFLRTSLFSSIISYGVALFAAGTGLLWILIGWAVRRTA